MTYQMRPMQAMPPATPLSMTGSVSMLPQPQPAAIGVPIAQSAATGVSMAGAMPTTGATPMVGQPQPYLTPMPVQYQQQVPVAAVPAATPLAAPTMARSTPMLQPQLSARSLHAPVTIPPAAVPAATPLAAPTMARSTPMLHPQLSARSLHAPVTIPPAAAPSEKPKPMIFALMRMAHEVIRGDMRDCGTEIYMNRNPMAFKQAWVKLKKFQAIHASMEEGVPGVCKGFFAILDEEYDDVAEENLNPMHHRIAPLETAVDTAVATSNDVSTLEAAYTRYWPENERHLKGEEDIMMPKVMEMRDAGMPMKQLMVKDILPAALQSDMPFFISHGVSTLAKHFPTGSPPKYCDFAIALKAVSNEQQWPQWNQIMKQSLSPQAYADLSALW